MLDLADVVVPVSEVTTLPARRWQEVLPPEAVEALLLRPWPYNLRELRATLLEFGQHASEPHALVSWLHPEAARASSRETRELPVTSYTATSVRMALPTVQGKRRGPSRREMERLIAETAGNVEEIGRRLQCARRQVYRWLDAVQLTTDDLTAARVRAAEEAKWRE